MGEQALADVGMIGLAVMGQNLALNMADHGFKVAVFNRTTQVMRRFVAQHPDTPGGLVGCEDLTDLLAAVKTPRKIILLVQAGPAVDAVVQQLFDAGIDRDDVVVDCGNSQWTDTIRREHAYAGRCQFFGSGVSGGEVGGGLVRRSCPAAMRRRGRTWSRSGRLLPPKWTNRRANRLRRARRGGRSPVACRAPRTLPNGAGHYVKMVHNGIEYIDMQLIAEAYSLLRHLLGAQPEALAEIFAQWNDGDLDSYLIQITADILQQRDPDHPDGFLVDYILDTAQQKGTGKWTSSTPSIWVCRLMRWPRPSLPAA